MRGFVRLVDFLYVVILLACVAHVLNSALLQPSANNGICDLSSFRESVGTSRFDEVVDWSIDAMRERLCEESGCKFNAADCRCHEPYDERGGIGSMPDGTDGCYNSDTTTTAVVSTASMAFQALRRAGNYLKPAGACAKLLDPIHRALQQQQPSTCPASIATPLSPPHVLVFWWYRFDGATRFARRDETFRCPTGLVCTCTANASRYGAADGAVVWVGARPHRHCLPPKARGQRWVLEFVEPAGYYPELRDASFLQRFDVTVSWRLSSSVVVSQAMSQLVLGGPFAPRTWLNQQRADTLRHRHEQNNTRTRTRTRARHHPSGVILPEVNAIAWTAGSCTNNPTPSRRESLIASLAAALGPALPLHAMGSCLHNFEDPGANAGREDGGGPSTGGLPGRRMYWRKIRTYSRYRFCIAAENSIEADWITEKLFHAFAAGCLPIYLGAPNVAMVLPAADAIVNVADFDSVPLLAEHLLRLASDEAALRRRLAWRSNATLVSAWWRSMRTLLDPQRLRRKEDQICAVCEAVHRTRNCGTRHPRPGT